MGNKPWKKLEREGAKMIGGKRWPGNVGGPVDFESEHLCGQAKLVQTMSLSELTAHALAIEAEAARRGKRAVLLVKLRSGKGVETPELIIVTRKMFASLFPEMAKEVPVA